MTNRFHFDLLVIGSGAAGSSAWFAARAMGKSVLVFEDDTLGGECPTWACVPTKALLHCAEVYDIARRAAAFGVSTGPVSFDYRAIRAYKDLAVSRTGAARGLAPFRENGVDVVQARARFTGSTTVDADGRSYSGERILIATGATTHQPDIEGLPDAGFLTYRKAIDLEAPPASLLILGGGPVACEFAQLFSTFGTAVTIVEKNDRLLPHEDLELGATLGELFAQRGVRPILGAAVTRVQRSGANRIASVSSAAGEEQVEAAEILVATGKTPSTDLGLEAAGVRFGEDGVEVDSTLRTSNPSVYAAGDVAGPYRFTHAASYQGGLATRHMFGSVTGVADYRAMPRCVFTSPEIATAGVTEASARQDGISARAGVAEIGGLGRANTSSEFGGFVKVLVDDHGVLIGAAAMMPRAGEVIHELALAIQLRATARQVADAVHAFPTFSEAVAEACSTVG